MTNFAGGTYEQQQADPVNQLIGSGKYRDIPNLQAYFDGRMSQEDAIATIKGTPLYDASKGPQVDAGSGPKTFTPDNTPGTPGKGTGTGYNAPGQGFYTPDILSNQAKAIADHLKQVSTMIPPPAAPPSRNKLPNTGIGDSSTATPTDNTPATPPTIGNTIDKMRSDFISANGPRPTLQPTDTSGITSAENDLNSAKSKVSDIENQILNEKGKVQTTPGLTRAYVGGELRNIDATTAEALRQAHADVTNATNALSAKNAAVSLAMKVNQQNYSDAAAAWDKNYASAVDAFKTANTADSKQQTQANASIKSFVSMFKGKTFDATTLSPELKAQIAGWEAQAGVPAGYTEALLKAQTESGIQPSTWETKNGVTYMQGHDAQGNPIILKTNPTTTNPAPKGGSSGVKPSTADINKMSAALDAAKGTDGAVDNATYQQAKRDWIAASPSHTAANFEANFKSYISKNKP